MLVAIRVTITNAEGGYKREKHTITEVKDRKEAYTIAEQLGEDLKEYFDITYFVSRQEYERLGEERAEELFEERLEENSDYVVREIIDTECIKRFEENSKRLFKEFVENTTKFFKNYTEEID